MGGLWGEVSFLWIWLVFQIWEISCHAPEHYIGPYGLIGDTPYLWDKKSSVCRLCDDPATVNSRSKFLGVWFFILVVAGSSSYFNNNQRRLRGIVFCGQRLWWVGGWLWRFPQAEQF
jgi:hypothetical protein